MKKALWLGVILGLMAACLAGTTLQSRRQYVVAHPEMSRTIQKAILAGKICLDMTEEEVLASLGRPAAINRGADSSGSRTQFVYEQIGGNYNFNLYHYVYFENGRVTRWSY
jgi:hypothetical protein